MLSFNPYAPDEGKNRYCPAGKSGPDSIEQELPCFPALDPRWLALAVLRDAVPLVGQPLRLPGSAA